VFGVEASRKNFAGRNSRVHSRLVRMDGIGLRRCSTGMSFGVSRRSWGMFGAKNCCVQFTWSASFHLKRVRLIITHICSKSTSLKFGGKLKIRLSLEPCCRSLTLTINGGLTWGEGARPPATIFTGCEAKKGSTKQKCPSIGAGFHLKPTINQTRNVQAF